MIQILENLKNSSKSQHTFKRANTWSIKDNASKYGYNFPTKTASDTKRISIENDIQEYDSIYNKNDIVENQEKQINERRSYTANIPFMSVGNIQNNEHNKKDEDKKNIFNKKKVINVYGKKKYRFSNLSTCNSIIDTNLNNTTSKKPDRLKFDNAGKIGHSFSIFTWKFCSIHI